MTNLWFVKFQDGQFNNVVLLQTAELAVDAIEFARERISEFCRAEYVLCEVTFVCTTPDQVDGFEPV